MGWLYWNARSYLVCVSAAATVQCFVSRECLDTLGYKALPVPGYKAAIPMVENPMSAELLAGCLEGIDPYTLEAGVANGANPSVAEDA